MISPSRLARNVLYEKQVSESGLLVKRVFNPKPKDKGEGLSVNQCKDPLLDEAAIEIFQIESACAFEPTKLERFGITLIDWDTVASIGLTIKHAPDDPANEVDPARRQFFEKYGHLHHLIQNPASEDLCPDQDQVVKLWNHANDLRLIWRPVERKFGAA